MKKNMPGYYNENTIIIPYEGGVSPMSYYTGGAGFFLLLFSQMLYYMPFDMEIFGYYITDINPILYHVITIAGFGSFVLFVLHKLIYQKLIYLDFKEKRFRYREKYIWSKDARKETVLDFQAIECIGIIAVTEYEEDSGERIYYYTYLVFDEKKCIRLKKFSSYEKAISYCIEIGDPFDIEIKDWIDVEYKSEYDFTKYYTMQTFD